MFHYHFRTKDDLPARAAAAVLRGDVRPPQRARAPGARRLARLRAALLFLATFVRDHEQCLGRVFADASGRRRGGGGLPARQRAAAPAPADRADERGGSGGELAPLPQLQRFVFTMGAVALPLVVVPHIAR
jgi:hypothetical protein